MSYCPKCGREILDESLGCPVCGVRENIDYSKKREEPKAEPVTEFTVEDSNGTSQRFESRVESSGTNRYHYEQSDPTPVEEKKLHPALKVLVIVMMIMVGGIGAIAGLVAGLVLMKSPVEDYRRFGKTMVIVGAVMIAIWFLCCVSAGVLGGLGFGGSYYYY